MIPEQLVVIYNDGVTSSIRAPVARVILSELTKTAFLVSPTPP